MDDARLGIAAVAPLPVLRPYLGQPALGALQRTMTIYAQVSLKEEALEKPKGSWRKGYCYTRCYA
ncbi:hypothetical protein OG394_22480 [Kribbella sp. NBC_01245]|uniref:hypothetical protein n=1 Tax=Kribbella sp. NBC_01245 TaxID=2903578 RepID=UPI002E2C8070|nr:hypothetical protein [Kribbella sp. NBC_01245]